jgi:3-oxoacyl-[acyl-carrier protein] reductase
MTFASLAGRVVVITGGGRGFGRELALAFADHGAKLALVAARSRDELDATVAEVNATRADCCIGLVADIASPKETVAAAAAAVSRFGRIDVLINNAARGPSDSMPHYDPIDPLPFWKADPERYAEVVDTNITGTFLMTRAVVTAMVAQGFGRIINLSTSRPTMVRRGAGPYGATKAALEANSVVWAMDVAGTGVTVNVLLPGAASDTALIPGGDVGGRAVPDYRPGLGERGDVGRIAGLLPADIVVPPALWLASDDSADWNGRRFIAKDWNPHLSPDLAFRRAMGDPAPLPNIM